MDRFFLCGVEIDADTFHKIAASYSDQENDQGGVDFFIEPYDLIEE